MSCLPEHVLGAQLVCGHHWCVDAVAQEAAEIAGRPEPGSVPLGQEDIVDDDEGVGDRAVERVDQLLRVTVNDPSATRESRCPNEKTSI